MMEIANHVHVQQGKSLDMAVKLVKEGQPAVAGYLTDVAYFVKSSVVAPAFLCSCK